MEYWNVGLCNNFPIYEYFSPLCQKQCCQYPTTPFSQNPLIPSFQYSCPAFAGWAKQTNLSFSDVSWSLSVVRLSKRKNQIIPYRYQCTVHTLILVRSHKPGHTKFFPLLQRGIEACPLRPETGTESGGATWRTYVVIWRISYIRSATLATHQGQVWARGISQINTISKISNLRLNQIWL